jgi:hypothetical protein
LSESDIDTCTIRHWPDADLNGDFSTSKSTSGTFLEIAGGDGRGVPICWGCTRQASTSVHTQEAEIVSLATSLRRDVIPLQFLMQLILNRPVKIEMREDNSATITAIKKGYSSSLRHLLRTQRISLGFLHECLTEPPERQKKDGAIVLEHHDTRSHKGDFFTKVLDRRAFEHGMEMIRMS